MGLCGAFPFGSLPRLHTFICYVSVLRLATTGLCSAFPLGSLSRLHTFVMSMCFALQTTCLCCAVFLRPLGLVRLYALFVLYSELCFAYFALQASGLLSAFTTFPLICTPLLPSYLSANFMFHEFTSQPVLHCCCFSVMYFILRHLHLIWYSIYCCAFVSLPFCFCHN